VRFGIPWFVINRLRFIQMMVYGSIIYHSVFHRCQKHWWWSQ